MHGSFLRDGELRARHFAVGSRNFRGNFHAVINYFDAVLRQSAFDHGFLDEMGYGDDTRHRPVRVREK